MTTSEQTFPTTNPPKIDKTIQSPCVLCLVSEFVRCLSQNKTSATGVGLLHGFPPRRAVLLTGRSLPRLGTSNLPPLPPETRPLRQSNLSWAKHVVANLETNWNELTGIIMPFHKLHWPTIVRSTLCNTCTHTYCILLYHIKFYYIVYIYITYYIIL